MSFSYVPVIFWAILYFLAQENVPDFTNGSSCNFPASAWELAVSLRSSREESDIWRLKSEYFVAYCFWLSSIAGLLVYRGGTYIHVNMCMCVCMYVYVYPGYYYNYFYICLYFKGSWICTVPPFHQYLKVIFSLSPFLICNFLLCEQENLLSLFSVSLFMCSISHSVSNFSPVLITPLAPTLFCCYLCGHYHPQKWRKGMGRKGEEREKKRKITCSGCKEGISFFFKFSL